MSPWWHLACAIKLCAGEARRERTTIEQARKRILSQMRRAWRRNNA
jgi:hypothetical protein